MMLWVILSFVPAVFASGIICPQGRFQCPDTTTCCLLPDRTYGCCPLQSAVCCDDHIHCCPKNSKCDNGMCIQSLYHENATRAVKAASVTSYNQMCAIDEYCPIFATCCPSEGKFDCCPLKNAICCPDFQHCCPQNTICGQDRCIGEGFISQMYDTQKQYNTPLVNTSQFTRITAAIERKLSNVICPGEEFQCPNGYTCCKLPNGNWGCCPFAKATCCPDHLHCCPENMKCSATSQSCLQGGPIKKSNVTWQEHKPAERITTAHDIICPDKRHCPENMTCCQLKSGKFACCPYRDAVCCPDHLHCCPRGFDCDSVLRQCIPKRNFPYKFMEKYLSHFYKF